MKNYKDLKYCRCVVNLEQSIKEWFQDEAALMSLPMGQYMAVVLVEHYRRMKNAQTVTELNDLLHSDEWKNTVAENGEMMEQLQLMFEEVQTENKPKLTGKSERGLKK
mgnify:CR=1 FL=1